MDQQETLPSRLLRYSQKPVGTFAIGSLVLIASLTNYLTYNSYPAFTPEVGLVVLSLVAMAAIAALIYAVSGQIIRLVLVSLLVFVAFDLNSLSDYSVIAAVIALVLLRDYALPFLGVVATTVLLSNAVPIMFPGDPAHAAVVQTIDGKVAEADTNRDLPAVLHILLDAHIGAEANVGSGEAEIAAEMKRFYDAKGFRLFGGAYSLHRRTVNAVPSLLNNDRDYNLNGHVSGLKLLRNRYFEYLAEKGYRIHVRQTDWINYCAGHAVEGIDAIHSCKSWTGAAPGPVLHAALPTTDKAVILTAQFVSLSKILLGGTVLYDRLAIFAHSHGWPITPLLFETKSQANTIGAVAMFDEVIEDVRAMQPGTVLFAHILLPHQPFALGRQCELRSPWTWKVQLSEIDSLHDRKMAYLDQMICTESKLAAVLDALDSSAAGGNSIVILHGDHGSRITDHEPFVENSDLYTDQDVIETYSTLFAVRAGNIEAGYDDRRIPIYRLLAELIETDFKAVGKAIKPDFRHTVVMENQEWFPVEKRELPESWLYPHGH